MGGLGRIKLTSYYTHYLPQVPSDTLIKQAGRIVAEAASIRAQASAAPAPRGGILPLWYDANAFAAVREEISFDEAALAAVGKPAAVATSIAHAKKPAAPTSASATDPAPARAGLGFQSSPTLPRTVGYSPSAAAPAMPAHTSGTAGLGGPPAPVPWPLKSDVGSNADFPQPVPWPLTAANKR
jgi:hypothetical protein